MYQQVLDSNFATKFHFFTKGEKTRQSLFSLKLDFISLQFDGFLTEYFKTDLRFSSKLLILKSPKAMPVSKKKIK